MSKRYNFIQATNEQNNLQYKPEKSINKFYQVCLFPNPHTNKYQIRRFKFNEFGECFDVSDFHLSKNNFNKFKKTYKQNEYKCYATFTLNNVNPPLIGVMLSAESELLKNKQTSYDGFLEL
jgi:hypothetical protein